MIAKKRSPVETLEIERFFFAPSFEAYGGVSGLWDLGPPGCAIERQILAKWHRHFVIEEDMCEVRCPTLTPYQVLENSGHTAKFADFMVTDPATHRLYRADHIIEQALDQRMSDPRNAARITEMTNDKAAAGDLTADGLQELIEKYAITSPEGNPLTSPVPFNLMFNSHIGPSDPAIPAFLRPETAQGIFLDFPRLLDFHRGELPFACAQTAVSYRNEISPKNGLIRCREFMMAEIEHFADPEALDDCPKFARVENLELVMYSASVQDVSGEPVTMRLSDAVAQKIVCHKTMGYYIGRTYLFFIEIGVPGDKIRFRQHRNNERAHYARDCWDCEVHCSVGWLECAGLSDRQSFDLTQHSKATARRGEECNPQMFAQVPLAAPVREEKLLVVPNKSKIGQNFKREAAAVLAALDALPQVETAAIFENVTQALEIIGHPDRDQEAAAIEALDPDAIRSFIPCVIEPSFGIGRILTVVLEHAFYVKPGRKPDEFKRVLKLSPSIAPFACVVLPLSANLPPEELVAGVRQTLKKAGIAHQVDSSSASLGKRYARADELGIPFAITLDAVTEEEGKVTLRERDSTAQVRLRVAEAVSEIHAMINEIDTWESISAKYERVKAVDQ
jgi:glycyl-tRNA synthetase